MWCWSRRRSTRPEPVEGRARRSLHRLTTSVALTLFSTAPLFAQSLERVTADSVVSVDVFGGENVASQPQVIIDPSIAVRLGDNWRVFARPWLRQSRPATPNGRTPDPDIELYEAGVRYERPGRLAMRVDAGYLASPIGIGILDWRPNNNPTILPHLGYVVPLLSFDPSLAVRALPVANTYPLTAQLTLSTTRWDVRAAVLNSSPTRTYIVGNSGVNPRQTANVVLGGGVTPVTGLRLGVSFARGAYATRDELTAPSAADRDATIVDGEGEFAFGYTSLRGELLHTTFDTAHGTAAATEWFLQGTQILSPRWLGAGRVEHVSGPTAAASAALRTDLDTFEATAGFRVTAEITLRGSYTTRRLYGAAAWDRQAGASVVWAKRWW